MFGELNMKLIEVRFLPVKIESIGNRWYQIKADTMAVLFFDNAMALVVDVRCGFKFDGRSGGILVDFFVPNLGKPTETWCFLVHDVLFYNFGITFKETNKIFRQQMRISPKYGRIKASVVHLFVSIFGKWSFGTKTEVDRINKRFIDAYWMESSEARHLIT